MRAIAIAIALSFSLPAMAAPSATPQALADEVLRRFAAGQPDAFAQIYPMSEGRALVRDAAEETLTLVPGLGRVLRQDGDRATLLLSGYPKTTNSGDGVVLSRAFAGIYDARRGDGEWKLTAFHRIDELNRIELQRLHVQVIPGQSLRVTDEMRIDVGAAYGFAARLNPKARIESVRWNGRTSRFAFGGALLWVPVAQHARGKLTIRYRIDDIEQGPESPGAGNFLRHAGHVRNEYFWHPFFDFDSTNDRATFVIDVTLPRAFELTTSLPQHERIDGPRRIILGASESPTMALTLAYARDWPGWNMDAGGFTVQLFTNDDFSPPPAEILAIYRETVQLLRDRFDVPPVAYFGVAQTESRAGRGFQFSSNSVVFTGGRGGGDAFRNDAYPRAFLSHEIAHRYTAGTGPGTNLLQEGWARFVESLCLRARFGADAERRFWKALADDYLAHADGKSSLLDDRTNSGVAYTKGAWIFRMLEGVLGEQHFDRAMRRFIHNCALKPQSIEEFLSMMQGEAPLDFDVTAFLEPWLKETSVPKLEWRLENDQLIITRSGAAFSGPVAVDLVTDGGKRREQVAIAGPQTTIGVGPGVRDVFIDPDERLLLRR